MRRDPLAVVLEAGLGLIVVLAPLFLGAVPPAGRLFLEAGAFVLGGVALARAVSRPTVLPPRLALAGLLGLLVLGLVQVAPLGLAAVSSLSPRAAAIHAERLPSDVEAEEARLLGMAPSSLDAPVRLSVDPPATASALRTGAALSCLLLVACAVAAERGLRGLALALLAAAALQSLLGILAAASGSESVWGIAARYPAGAATGTFVNKNHFAAFVAASLPAGLALVLSRFRRHRESGRRLAEILGGEGSRTLLLLLLAVVALAGLLLSFSRAGIAVGVLAVLLTFAAARRRGLRLGIAAALLVGAVAAIPLLQLGADRLAEAYGRAADEWTLEGGRVTVWHDTLRIAAAFPLTGAGFGAYASVWPAFRTSDTRAVFDHAHCDPLQVPAEGGALAALGLALLAVPVARRVAGGLAGRGGTVAAGFAAGLAALALHSLVDFPFHIPAVAAVGAVLAGALLGAAWNGRR